MTQGWEEIVRANGIMWGFNYVNPQLIELMKELQHQYLSHVNRYTRPGLQGRSRGRRRPDHQRE